MAMAPPLPAAPSAGVVIHDIADDEDEPIRFDFGDDQTALLASFESLPRDAERREARVAEEEARSHAIAMSRSYLCSDLDSVSRRGPDPAGVEQENLEPANTIAVRDEEVVTTAREKACYHADMAATEAGRRRRRRESTRTPLWTRPSNAAGRVIRLQRIDNFLYYMLFY
jgi:hypothetical protein